MSRESNTRSTLLVLRELTLASPVIAPSRNNIEQEVLLLLVDEYRPTCSFSMTNPGSLTMVFAEANTMVRDPGLVIEKEQVGRYSSTNRRSTSCSILLREGAITGEAKVSSRKTRRVDRVLD